MPWETVKLNDGHSMPSIAFGTWKMGNGDAPIQQVDQAIHVGFNHVDTAQAYGNEEEAGKAIRDSGLAREDIFITTKFSGRDNLGIRASIKQSLEKLGVSYVDLYLIHHPSLAQPDIPTAWKIMEDIQAEGLVKSIGVSNFQVPELAILLASAKVKPAANQIMLHPYVYTKQLATMEYCAKQGIVIEGYSPLIPITQLPNGPLDKPLDRITARLDVTPDQVLMAWAKAKGAVVVTTSSKKSRLEGYLNAGDLELTTEDIRDLDVAGAIGTSFHHHLVYRATETKVGRATVGGFLALVGTAVLLGAWGYFGSGCGSI